MREDSLTLLAVGDVSLNGRYHRSLAEGGPSYPFDALPPDWHRADIRLGNLESPIASGKRASEAKLTLRAAPQTAASLRAAGFDCVSVANNHMMDFGPEGILETCERLAQSGIPHTGAGQSIEDASAPAIIRRNGLSLGVLAFCDVEQVSPLYATRDTPGVAPATLENCTQAIRDLRNQVDWVVVQMHWGVEMSQLPSPAQRQWARSLVAAGADLIIGHHPHVLQPLEYVDGVPVAYSLGDFTFSSTYWHGTNGSGKPFLAHFEVHPLSRRTGWLEVVFRRRQKPHATFHPALLAADLRVIPDASAHRQHEWEALASQLNVSDYAAVVDESRALAGQRDQWRMDYRRFSTRLGIKLLQYGLLPSTAVEPDGTAWRAHFHSKAEERRSANTVSSQAADESSPRARPQAPFRKTETGRLVQLAGQKYNRLRREVYQRCFCRASDSKHVLFIFGCQRSGTTLLGDVLANDLRSAVLQEQSCLTGERTLRLRPFDEVKRILGTLRAPLVVAKPLVESQRAADLLIAIEHARGVWMYRNFRDVVHSNVRRFRSQLQGLRSVVTGEPKTWRNERVSEETLSTLRRFYYEGMPREDAAALGWYARNRLFFEQELDGHPRAIPCKYEHLASDPQDVVLRIYRHLGLAAPRRRITGGVDRNSMGLGRKIEIDPRIADLCEALQARLDSCYDRLCAGLPMRPEEEVTPLRQSHAHLAGLGPIIGASESTVSVPAARQTVLQREA